jgi:hypothetical protein
MQSSSLRLRVCGSNASQWIAYDTNGFGDNRLTMTAKIRSKQVGNESSILFSQQGNENAGGKYFHTVVDLPSPPTSSWVSVSVTMCETSGRNNAVGVHFSTAPGKTLYVDDVTFSIARDSRLAAEGGCIPPPPPTPPTPCQQTNTCPPPTDDPCTGNICHAFDQDVDTDIKALTGECMVSSGQSIVLLTTSSCLIVRPDFISDGINLRVVDSSGNLTGQCLGAIGYGVGLQPCSFLTRVTDWALVAGINPPAFPIRRLPTSSETYQTTQCLDKDLTFGQCDGVSTEAWLDGAPRVCEGYDHDGETLSVSAPARTDLASAQYKSKGSSAIAALNSSVINSAADAAGAAPNWGENFAVTNLRWYMQGTGATRANIGEEGMWRIAKAGNIPTVIRDVINLNINPATAAIGTPFASSIVPSALPDRRSKSGDPSGTMTNAPGWFRIFSPDPTNGAAQQADYSGTRNSLVDPIYRGFGSFDLRVQGRVVAYGHTPVLCFRIFLTDRYMFENTGLAAVGNLIDDDLVDLHARGYARNFDIYGRTGRSCYLKPGSGVTCNKAWFW